MFRALPRNTCGRRTRVPTPIGAPVLSKSSPRRRFSGKTTSQRSPVVTKGSTATPTKVGGDTVGFKTPNATSKAALGRRQRRDGLVGKRLSIFIEIEAT